MNKDVFDEGLVAYRQWVCRMCNKVNEGEVPVTTPWSGCILTCSQCGQDYWVTRQHVHDPIVPIMNPDKLKGKDI